MSPLLHDGPRGSAAMVERCIIGDDHLSAQPSRTPGESPTSPCPLYITVRSGAATRLSSGFTEIGHPRLATLLDSLIDTDRGEIIVHLAKAVLVDAALLPVLRAARARLAGGLTVIADRAETRFQLTLVGLDGRVGRAGTPRARVQQMFSAEHADRRGPHTGGSVRPISIAAVLAVCTGDCSTAGDLGREPGEPAMRLPEHA